MAQKLSALPVGALIKDANTTYNGKPIVFKVMEHGHAGDPMGSTALVTNNIITLKCFDALESSNSNSDRQKYGNNRYAHSNLRQWLNSNKTSWYTAQHTKDAAPTNANVYSNYNEYDTEVGFLTNFSEEFNNALIATTKRVAKNTVTDGGSYEDVEDKIFLLSNTEVGLANENNIVEGSIYSLFNTSSNRIAYPTAEAVSKSEYTNSNLASSKAWYWWLRTPIASNSGNARYVGTDGTLRSNDAYGGTYGVRPACCIPSSIYVSDEAGSDGAYTIIWNPQVTVESNELGTITGKQTINYVVTDLTGEKVGVVIKLDNNIVETIEDVITNEQIQFELTVKMFNECNVGTHTINIKATDSLGGIASQNIIFTKNSSTIIISGEDEDLGEIWQGLELTYNINDNSSETVIAYEYTNDVLTNTITDVTLNENMMFDTSQLVLGKNVLHIKAINGSGSVSWREYTVYVLDSKLVFQTNSIPTDEAANNIVVNMIYDTTGEPTVKIEVTNNASASEPTWEDMTQEWMQNKAYTFQNKPSEDYGVAVRVTLEKNENTKYVYVNGLGFSYS